MKTNELTVSVINEGEGIPEKYIDRVTERFFRVDKARSRKIGGTGLGLAIVKKIVKENNAQISLNNKKDESGKISGVTARIEFLNIRKTKRM